MKKYFLSKQVYLAAVDSHIIFLDLAQDSYSGLVPEQANFFLSFMGSQPQLLNKNNLANKKKIDKEILDNNSLLHNLENKGIITQDRHKGKIIEPMFISEPSMDLSGYLVGEKPKLNLGHLYCYFKSAIRSTFYLNTYSLNTTIKIVTRIKNKKNTELFNLKKTQNLLEIYRSLRPLYYPAKEKCLYDALSLIIFLSYYRIYPDWIFGVKVGPFSAHCWVQYKDILLNETAGNISEYKPILLV